MDDFESDQVIAAPATLCREAGRSSSAPAASPRRRRSRAAKRAAEHGADAVLVRTPGFFKIADDDRRVRPALHGGGGRVAGAGAPLQLHGASPASTCCRPRSRGSPTHPNIIGMKESGGDIAQVADLVSSTPDDFNVLAGRRRHVLRRAVRRAPSAAFSRSPVCCRRPAPLVRADGRPPRRGARAAASRVRSRGCSAPPTACPA